MKQSYVSNHGWAHPPNKAMHSAMGNTGAFAVSFPYGVVVHLRRSRAPMNKASRLQHILQLESKSKELLLR